MSLGTHSDVRIDHIVYVLNDEQKTAKIVNFTRQINQATIPSIIKIKSQEYTVLINKNTFHYSLIEDITFSSDFHLEEGLFQYPKLKRVRINPCDRVLLKNYSNKLVLKRSDTNSTIFDVFLFAPAELTKIRIPPFIKRLEHFLALDAK